jgi:hypothetical protein
MPFQGIAEPIDGLELSHTGRTAKVVTKNGIPQVRINIDVEFILVLRPTPHSASQPTPHRPPPPPPHTSGGADK